MNNIIWTPTAWKEYTEWQGQDMKTSNIQCLKEKRQRKAGLRNQTSLLRCRDLGDDKYCT